MKREHPDLFRVQRGLTKGRWTFSAIGNRFLLDRPELLQVQCSRSLTSDEIETMLRVLKDEGEEAAFAYVRSRLAGGPRREMREQDTDGKTQ